ncbi:hypothetical protein V2G26_007092 [Clonostachys chloroleuca]
MQDHQIIPNIYIVGAQCSGKTTLVNQLTVQLEDLCSELEICKPVVISEVARSVLKRHPIATEDIRASPGKSLVLQKLILDAQSQAEEEALTCSSWFLSDRSGLDPIVYAKRYVGPDAAYELICSGSFIKIKDRIMSGSVVVICEPGVAEFVNDAVRLVPEDHQDWLRFHQFFCDTLDELGLKYDVLPCSISSFSNRIDFVLNKWMECYSQCS